jgi:CarD family transcriptional regulator
VIKGLMWRDAQRGLSNGERKMLHTAKQILISEIVLVQGTVYQTTEQQINETMMAGVR